MRKETIKIKKQAKEFFKKNKSISCPAFPNEKIVFNSKGLRHLFYKGQNKGRPLKEAKIRVELLTRVVTTLTLMPLFQEERIIKSYEEGKTARFWAFEAVIEERRIKIIVRQIGRGKKHFWSVIPSWKRIQGKRVNAKSDFWKE